MTRRSALLRERVAATASATRRDRVELVGIDFHWPNASMTHRLEQTLGYNPVRLRWYSEATGAGDHVALPSQRQFSPLFPSYRSRLGEPAGLALHRVRRARWKTSTSVSRAGPIADRGRTAEAVIYENAEAGPRVMFATQWQQADFGSMIQSGIWPFILRRDRLAGTTAGVRAAAARGAHRGDPSRHSHRIVSQHRGGD